MKTVKPEEFMAQAGSILDDLKRELADCPPGERDRAARLAALGFGLGAAAVAAWVMGVLAGDDKVKAGEAYYRWVQEEVQSMCSEGAVNVYPRLLS